MRREGALLLAAMAGAVVLTAGETVEPVRERQIITPDGERVIIIEPEPVAERTRSNPNGIYFNPLTKSWERPPPFGPYPQP